MSRIRAVLRTCAGCGCTDHNACIDPETFEPCAWVEGVDMDICTRCAAIALRMAEADEMDVAHRIYVEATGSECPSCGTAVDPYSTNASGLCGACEDKQAEPLVQLYSEGEANRAIAVMRAGGSL